METESEMGGEQGKGFQFKSCSYVFVHFKNSFLGKSMVIFFTVIKTLRLDLGHADRLQLFRKFVSKVAFNNLNQASHNKWNLPRTDIFQIYLSRSVKTFEILACISDNYLRLTTKHTQILQHYPHLPLKVVMGSIFVFSLAINIGKDHTKNMSENCFFISVVIGVCCWLVLNNVSFVWDTTLICY